MTVRDSISMETLHSLESYKNKTFVIKYGGSIVKNIIAQKAFIEDIALLREYGINIVIVHGGGPEINRWLDKTGIESSFVQGLRVTDEATMEIVEMVLSGSVNKKLTHSIGLQGVAAIGISGRDSNLITAAKKYIYDEAGERIDIGFVGEVTKINSELLYKLLDSGLLPVISPIGCDAEGNVYNINADYSAGAVAAALKAEKLIIMTDIEGVFKDINDKSTLITSITPKEINDYIEDGIIKGGMIPKMQCCIDAISKGAKNVHLIDGRKEHSLLIDTFNNLGTKILEKEV